MASYGVQTNNLFDLLDEEGSVQKTKGADKKAAEPAKPKVGAKKEAAQRAAAEEAAATQKPRGAGRPGMPEAPQFAPRENRTDRGRGRGRGRGTGRGGFADRGKREFDRRGAPRSKAPGAPAKGGHRLGDAAEVPSEEAPATEETPAAEEPVVAEPVAEPEPVEEDDGSVTYDEFMAQQKSKVVADDIEKKLREVEVDDKKWKAGKVINPGADAKVAEEKKAPVADKKPKKQILSLDEFVGDVPRPAQRREAPAADNGSFRGRGGRGGRGAARGGRGGRVASGPVVNPSDETAFPKLGK